MTSARKIKTNRSNARASTGPKTKRGKARAARNARHHGLSLPAISDPALSEQAELLARKIIGKANDNKKACELARRVAETQIDLIRIRQARHDLLAHNVSDPDYRRAEESIFAFKLAKKVGRIIGMCTPMPPIIMGQF